MFTHKSKSLARRVGAGVLLASFLVPAMALAAFDDARSNVKPTTTLSVEPSFVVGSLLVERVGTTGRPIILIPGLASGSWVWADTAKRLQDTHVVYLVTLSGFNGRPAPAGSGALMKEALLSLKQLILTQQLEKPVVIGHSLGGVLSMALAEENSNLVSGVISIDGLPVFPGTEAMSLAQRPAMAIRIKDSMSGLDQEKFAAQQVDYMRNIGVLDAALADRLAKFTSKSDANATVGYMAETLELDLRPNLGKIGVPVLVISPYNAADSAIRNISETAKTDYYRSLMAGTPKLNVVSISPARHFVMFDQPEQVAATIDKYLKDLETL